MKWYIQNIKKENSELQEVHRLLKTAGQRVVEIGLKDGSLWDASDSQYITQETDKAIFLGSYSVGRLFQKISPDAVFDLDEYTYSDWTEIFGAQNVLNADAYVGHSSAIPWNGSHLFVRPLHDNKAFNGAIFSENSLSYDGLIVASSIKKIFSESRCFVVDGQVVTSSLYKLNGEFHTSGVVDGDVLEFAQCMANKFTHSGFSMDVAKTPEGLKIVELNCLNYSGFYSANLAKLIDALLIHYGE